MNGPQTTEASPVDAGLLALLRQLAARAYRFTTPTPLTHARVVARTGRDTARDLVDVFGWSLPFEAGLLGDELLELMRRAEVLEPADCHDGQRFRSRIRVSSLGDALYAHSAYPTLAADAVFFGPDTYRFSRFVADHLPVAGERPIRAVDIGCGSGAGAIDAARRRPGSQWLLTDINPQALRLARVNARAAGISVQTLLSDVLAATTGRFDLAICNPPYLADAQARAYRHGGGSLGRELSLRIAREASARLAPGGRLLLYTGVAIVDGVDPFLAEIRTLFAGSAFNWRYSEIDPDVFGEELETEAYAQADRIAAIGLCVDRAQFDGG